MCVIIYKPAGEEIDRDLIRNAYSHNPEGFGLMYSENGRVHTIKGLFPIDQILYLIKRHQSRKLAIHLRRRTVGEVNKNNVHPFQVLDKREHGTDLWLMHNGTFRSIQATDGNCDTVIFAKQLQHRIMNGEIDINNAEHLEALQDEILGYNKVLLMNGAGDVITLNKKSWHQRGRLWFSNEYSLEPMNYYAGRGRFVKVGNDYGTIGGSVGNDMSSWF